MNELNMSLAISKMVKRLRKHKITVSQCNDFTDFESIGDKVRKLAGKDGVSGHFHRARFELNAENAFWLQYSKGGEPIAVAAYRQDRLPRNMTLADLWADQYTRIYPKPNAIGSQHASLADDITGKVAYVGEFTLPPDEQGNGLGGMMVFLGMMLCLQRWNELDWLYGLMNSELAKNGGGAKMGFDRSQPWGTDWLEEPAGIKSSDWICGIQRGQMERWADLIATEGLSILLPRHTK